MIGTVWITSDKIIKEFIETNGTDLGINKEKFFSASGMKDSLPKNNSGKSFLNFSWIMLEFEKEIDISSWKIRKNSGNSEVSILTDFFNEIEHKVCIVSKEIFQHIVNSNLETRTSVSINPVTGAAESGALFTYEALPRGTVFIMDVTYENPKNYGNEEYSGNDGLNIVIRTVEKGFDLFSSLGIGGMGTRGFGKIETKGNMLDEKEYWMGVKRHIDNLKNKYEDLNTKFTEVEEKIRSSSGEDKRKKLEKDKTQLCKEIGKIKKIINLYKAYIESQKEKLKENIDNFQQIYDVISSIDITVPENCTQNSAEEEQNGQ